MRVLIDTNILLRSVQRVNGLGLSITATDHYVSEIERFAEVLPDSAESFKIWRRIVVEHAVVGIRVHDARLVEGMVAHKITQIVTFNVMDFTRFTAAGIEAVHPESMS